jgi:hypothetical protein
MVHERFSSTLRPSSLRPKWQNCVQALVRQSNDVCVAGDSLNILGVVGLFERENRRLNPQRAI